MTFSSRAVLAAGMVAAMLAAPMAATPALAQRGPWGPGWRGSDWQDRAFPGDSSWRRGESTSRHRDPREGRVDVSRFVIAGPAADKLGHGAIDVDSQAGEGAWIEPARRAAYEAAVVDALVHAGYDTRHPADAGTQTVSLQIARQVLVPAEEKRSPVSGTAAMSVGTRGSAYGLAVDVDLSKPRPALVSTRLDARIVDRASGTVLWEGYATIATREGDSGGDGGWSEDRIATTLAAALFDKFPKADTIVPASAPGA